MKHSVRLLVLCLTASFPYALTQACTSAMPYANMQYLTSAELATYKLTDPCSIKCQAGYFGEFCEPNTKYESIPQGPWNIAGYFIAGSSILKTMTLDVSSLTQISYTDVDNILVGVYNPQRSSSAVMQVSLVSRKMSKIYATPAGGSVDALQVRYGSIFVAKSTSDSGPYDVSVLSEDQGTGAYTPTLFMSIPYRANSIEIVKDKGMNTTFLYSTSNQIHSCTPDQVCRKWYDGSGVTGMVCGIDCPKRLYISVSKWVLQLTDNNGVIQTSTLVSHDSNVNCLASVPGMNTILYRVGLNVKQYSSTATVTSTYDTVLSLSYQTSSVCSLDVSDSGAQILIIENGIINTLEALQQPCEYGRTSAAVSSVSAQACVPCPPPPDNAYLVLGSVTCQWQCYPGFARTASHCIGELTPPCPAGYTANSGVCIPARQPWAEAGSYVSGVASSSARTISAGITPVVFPIKAAARGALAFMSMAEKLYVSKTYGTSWQLIDPVLSTTATSQCGSNTNNQYNLLAYQGSFLFVGFVLRGISPTQHCLWMLNVSMMERSQSLTDRPTLVQYWALPGQLCSASGDLARVYLLFCGTHYILSSTLAGERPTIFAGQARAGYADGTAQSALFSSPSSLAMYNQRLYVADSGNCAIREIDVPRRLTATVAGQAGICQRQDGVESGLEGPSLLTPSAYDGYFLFADQRRGGSAPAPVIRQFHALTGWVHTLATSSLPKVSMILGYSNRFQLAYGEDFNDIYDITALTAPCPSGSMSLPGNSFASTDCLACGSAFYSVGSACVPCSRPTCSAAGQMPVLCTGNTDSYCGNCTNKPSNRLSRYTGPATSYDSGSDCPWVYLPPCPAAFYSSSVSGVFTANRTDVVCVSCPPWSTSTASDLTSVRQCSCLGGGSMAADNTCVIASPFTATPAACGPLTACPSHSYPAFPFPISGTCSYAIMDTPLGVCRCQPGEYISQIYPKKCSPCPAHLYSPLGESCQRCPPYAEPSLDSSACRCAAGTQDTDLAEETLRCVCGEGRGFSAQLGCYRCPENHYSNDALTLGDSPWTQSKECIPCEAGAWAPAGARQCTPCPMGTYRTPSMQECTACQPGEYATNPASGTSCTPCATECGGRRQTPCPTGQSRFVCVDCPLPRANAAPNGLDDCATSCNAGFYERDGECTGCSQFNQTTCPAGYTLIPCSAYSDAACTPCVNATKPLYYSRWAAPGAAASASCAWECIEGYQAKSVALVVEGAEVWECAKENAWGMFDLFTW